MAWFRNLTTGLVWEVSGDLAERLAADTNYEAAEMPTAAAEPEAETPKAKRRKGSEESE